MESSNRVIFALDVPGIIEADKYMTMLEGHVGGFKVGLELFIGAGPCVTYITKHPIMLDLKLHDIPETVERAVKRAGDLGVKFLTLHVQQKETMKRAVKAAENYKMQLLGVTVLTSMTEEDCLSLQLGVPPFHAPSVRTKIMAMIGWECGITGFVCSPQEVRDLREMMPTATLVVPGVRPAGSNQDDQKRTGTPKEAIDNGADYLVIGRPIRDAADPVAAADSIVREIRI